MWTTDRRLRRTQLLCSHSSTAQMGVTYIRTVLPADAYGRQRCNVVLSACSVVYLWCMSWAVCSLERATKTYKILPVRTYRVRPHAENPGNCLTHSQRKKTLSACHASCSARMELKPRPTCPDGLPVSAYLAFCRKVLARRDIFERGRKIHNYTYTYKAPLRDVVPEGTKRVG